MKVAQINSVCGFGSTGKIIVGICNALKKEGGNECTVIYGRDNTDNTVESYKITADKETLFNGVLSRIFDNQGFGTKSSAKKAVEFLKTYDPDIIHLHNIHGYYLNAEVLFEYLKEAKKPIVWTLHDCWPFTGHCAYFDFEGCTKWKTGCFSCPGKHNYPESLLLDRSKTNYKKKKALFNGLDNLTLVTPSLWLKDVVKESFLGGYDCRVINNGIDLSVFKPYSDSVDITEKYGIPGNIYHDLNTTIVLAVANKWEPRKGLEWLVKLSTILPRDCRMIIVGVSKEQKAQLPPDVIGVERTENAYDLAALYSLADVFVNTTLDDNFPTTNIEALACGLPVITFRTGGSPEIIDENTGFCVEKCDIESIKKIIEDRLFDRCSAENCVSRAKQFSGELKFKEYVELYREILSR